MKRWVSSWELRQKTHRKGEASAKIDTTVSCNVTSPSLLHDYAPKSTAHPKHGHLSNNVFISIH